MATVGLTTTVPVEVILAAGHRPMDLNNAFITDEEPLSLVAHSILNGRTRLASFMTASSPQWEKMLGPSTCTTNSSRLSRWLNLPASCHRAREAFSTTSRGCLRSAAPPMWLDTSPHAGS